MPNNSFLIRSVVSLRVYIHKQNTCFLSEAGYLLRTLPLCKCAHTDPCPGHGRLCCTASESLLLDTSPVPPHPALAAPQASYAHSCLWASVPAGPLLKTVSAFL